MQLVHFNGVGYESWENVWGIWNGFTPRAGEALKRVSKVWHYLGKYHYTYDFKEWVPHTEEIGPRERLIFASKFTHENGNHVYMVVNRGDDNQTAQVWTADTNRTYVDLMTGEKLEYLEPQQHYWFDIEANGFAAILAVDEVDQELEALLEDMKNMSSAGSLSSYSNEWKFLTQEMVGMNSSNITTNGDPEGMALIPRNDMYHFSANGTE
jgi:hypothetical protein